MDQDEILLDCEDRMDKAVGVYQGQLQGLRTGRATPALVDSLRVEAYGAPTPLKQLAAISVPEPQQIVIRPFDPGVISDIVKAIQASELGLSPNSDGRLIRLSIPSPSSHRRPHQAMTTDPAACATSTQPHHSIVGLAHSTKFRV